MKLVALIFQVASVEGHCSSWIRDWKGNPIADVVVFRTMFVGNISSKEGKVGVPGQFSKSVVIGLVEDLELTEPVKPAVNQIEVNPWYQQNQEVKFAQGEGIRVEAWAPSAEGKHNIFTNETIAKIAAKYGKSNGQVILRWLLQRGITVIQKSVHQKRMAENIDVFDFELSDDDMKAMAGLDKNESQFFDHRDPVTIEQIFGSSLRVVQDDEKNKF